MRHLGKLLALAVATLALITPVAAQADPGINANYSDGWVEFVGKTKCSWTGVPISTFPPTTVVVDKDNVSVTCTNGYWGILNQDLVVTFTDGPGDTGTASVATADVTGGAFVFWCQYIKSPIGLTRTTGTREYTGGYSVDLYDSNWADQCSDPATVNVWVKFYQA